MYSIVFELHRSNTCNYRKLAYFKDGTFRWRTLFKAELPTRFPK